LIAINDCNRLRSVREFLTIKIRTVFTPLLLLLNAAFNYAWATDDIIAGFPNLMGALLVANLQYKQ